MRPKFKILAMLIIPLAAGCGGDDHVPKPRGYFRIDLPEQKYVAWEDPAVMAAEIPGYARMAKRREAEGTHWYDLRFGGQRATIHLTWTPVEGRLMHLIGDAHTFRGTHETKAARIVRTPVIRPNARVFGNMYHVEGDVASPMVFYLTDSTDNFLYGSLYFDVRPNADSLAPVTERIREDMTHFAGTLEWR